LLLSRLSFLLVGTIYIPAVKVDTSITAGASTASTGGSDCATLDSWLRPATTASAGQAQRGAEVRFFVWLVVSEAMVHQDLQQVANPASTWQYHMLRNKYRNGFDIAILLP
jgi:hypothetical protein